MCRQDWALAVLGVALALGSAAHAEADKVSQDVPPAVVEGLFAALEDRNADVAVLALMGLTTGQPWEMHLSPASKARLHEKLKTLAARGRIQELAWAERKDIRESLAWIAVQGEGIEAKERLPLLLTLLKDPESGVRSKAAQALGGVESVPTEQLPLLLTLLKAPESAVRGAAARVLGGLERVPAEQLPLLVSLLEDSESDVRSAAAKALGRMGSRAKEQLSRLGGLLKHPRREVRQAAAAALVRIGSNAKEHAPVLVRLLQDPSAEMRLAAAAALGQMGSTASEQAPLLGSLLKDPIPDVRQAAAHALGRMGSAAKDQVPLLGGLLRDPSRQVSEEAVIALLKMGTAAKEHALVLFNLLKAPTYWPRDYWGFRSEVKSALRMTSDPEEWTAATGERQEVLIALARIGSEAKEQAPAWARLLKDPDPVVRLAAASALNDGPLLVGLLKSSDPEVRSSAIEVLRSTVSATKEQVPLLIGLLKDRRAEVRLAARRVLEHNAKLLMPVSGLLEDLDSDVRFVAVSAIGKMGSAAKEQIPLLLNLFNDPASEVRSAVANAIGEIGSAAKEQIPLLGGLLKDPDSDVRRAALNALGKMGSAAESQVPVIGGLLKDPDPNVRRAALDALGKMGSAAESQVPLIGSLLRDADPDVRRAAMNALGRIGRAAKSQIAPLVVVLKEEVRTSAKDGGGHAEAKVLIDIAPLDVSEIAPLVALVDDDSAFRASWLALAHASGGGDPRIERILQWIGRPANSEKPTSLTAEETRETLTAFADFWTATEGYPPLRADLAAQIANVVNLSRSHLGRADLPLLKLHAKNLKAAGFTQTDTLKAVIDGVSIWSRLANIGWGWTAHFCFWVLLLFAYPRSPRVQALFFWNPWIRNIAGLGYVGLLLTWIPPLRRRLLAPFRTSLLADAVLERFSPNAYFAHSEVLNPKSGQRQLLLESLPRLHGQVVLEGDSGLGKSMFLRYLLSTSKRLAVYLPAERCKDGVIEAIQAKLEGQARDTAFLQSIIYSGALDIYVDGLNEVTADTRAKIVQFTERNFHGNILLTTQRIEWTPPPMARFFVLQPLSEAHISEFLTSREPLLDASAKLHGEQYVAACKQFVETSLSPRISEDLRRAVRETLSNPMDLTVVAQMLSEEHSPDPFHLREQQYERMAEDYRRMHLAEFPLKAFSEAVFQMRLKDEALIPEEPFSRELLRLEASKLVLRRQWRGPDGKDHREWRFRHDKIQEFFIARTFLGDGNTRVTELLGDPRFRGVYFLLAQLLEPEKATELRDLLVEYAAETRDHTVSDQFVNLLKERRKSEKALSATADKKLANAS